MKTRIALLSLTVAVSLASGCASAVQQNAAMAASRHGTDGAVVDKLEHGRQLSLNDLEELGRRGVPDAVILAHLRRRDDAYRLTATEVVRLREAGVSDRVINYLLESRERYARRSRRYHPAFGHHHHHAFGYHSGGFGRGGFGHGGGHHSGGHH